MTTGEKSLIGAIIEQAVSDAAYLLAVAQGARGSLARIKHSLDAPDWVLGPPLDAAAAWLDLPPDFVDQTRAVVLPLDST